MLHLVFLLFGAAAPPQEQWILVVPDAYRTAAAPLVAQRRAQGMRVVVLPPSEPASLRKKIASVCKAHFGASCILLLGAVESPHAGRVVPSCVGTVSRMKGEPTDAPYGCLGASRMPSVAVGRLPARTPEEAAAMVAKTLSLEKAPPGPWKRRLTVLAGIPAFNPLVDRLVESAAFSQFDRIAPAWSGMALYTSPSSRFCVPARQLKANSLALLQQGQLLTLYLGHSNARGLYAGNTAFLDRDDFARARMPHAGLFVTFGCLGCQLRGRGGEGYGLSAIRNPLGPSAVIGSHGICFAAMCQLAADSLCNKALVGNLPARLGACHLAALEGVARGKMDFFTFRMLDAVDGDPKIPQETQRQEHLEMFLLLGDPGMRLPAAPDRIHLEQIGKVKAGGVLTVRGEIPDHLVSGTLELVLERTPGSVPTPLLPVPASGKERDNALLANFAVANRFQILRASTRTRGAAFAARLPLPDELPWSHIVLRVRAAKGDGEALTARRLEVEK